MNTTPGASWQPLQGPLRKLPARAAEQTAPRDTRQVCARCLGGTCCTTEGPIALTAFDVLRLAAALDLSPARFFELFTQDHFEGPDGARYRAWLEEPGSSVVSFLRRRTLAAASPCLFLRYTTEPDGTPRRVCSVHAARPLACREYYHDTCAKRWTGEMALLQAEGYEALRDGLVSGRDSAQRLASLPAPAPGEALSLSWQRAFWAELQRAAAPDVANAEGAAQLGLAALQDAVDVKIDRLLSTANLRFEEKYGGEPRDEQLHTFSGGLGAVPEQERARLLHIATTAAAAAATDTHAAGRAQGAGALHLFADDDLPWHLGRRALLNPQPDVLQELLDLSAQWRRLPDPAETESAADLHVALALALQAQPQATRARVQKAAALHAELALQAVQRAVDNTADTHDTSDTADTAAVMTAMNALARLQRVKGPGWRADVNKAGPARVLQPWLTPAQQRALRPWLRNWQAHMQEPGTAAAALSWWPLASCCMKTVGLRQLLTQAWASRQLAKADDDTMLAWLGFSAAFPNLGVQPAAWAHAAWQRHAARASVWDGTGSALAPLWHDGYLLRALHHAALCGPLEPAPPAPASPPTGRR